MVSSEKCSQKGEEGKSSLSLFFPAVLEFNGMIYEVLKLSVFPDVYLMCFLKVVLKALQKRGFSGLSV